MRLCVHTSPIFTLFGSSRLPTTLVITSRSVNSPLSSPPSTTTHPPVRFFDIASTACWTVVSEVTTVGAPVRISPIPATHHLLGTSPSL
jgi:hypothetical protein